MAHIAPATASAVWSSSNEHAAEFHKIASFLRRHQAGNCGLHAYGDAELSLASVLYHQIGPSVIGQDGEMCLSAGQREVRLVANALQPRRFDGLLADGAEVALAEPGAALFSRDAGDTFAAQIGPMKSHTVEPDWQVLQAPSVDILLKMRAGSSGSAMREFSSASPKPTACPSQMSSTSFTHRNIR